MLGRRAIRNVEMNYLTLQSNKSNMLRFSKYFLVTNTLCNLMFGPKHAEVNIDHRFKVTGIKSAKIYQKPLRLIIIIIIIWGFYIPLYHNKCSRLKAVYKSLPVVIGPLATSHCLSQLPGEHTAGAAISALTAYTRHFSHCPTTYSFTAESTGTIEVKYLVQGYNTVPGRDRTCDPSVASPVSYH